MQSLWRTLFQGVQVGRCFFCRRPKVKRVLSGELKSMRRDVCGAWQRKAPWRVFLVLWCTAVPEKERTFWKKQGTSGGKSPAFFSFVSPCENGSGCVGKPLWAKVDNGGREPRRRSKKMRRERRHREGAEDMPPSPSDKKIPALTKRAGMGN